MFPISELKQFSKFLEAIQEICTPFAAVSKFWKVLVSEWKAPQVFAATLFNVVFVPSTNIQSHGQAAAFLSLLLSKIYSFDRRHLDEQWNIMVWV